MKKYLFTMLVLVLYVSSGICQTITVVDKETQEPLAGVNIFTDDYSISATTDGKGKVSVEKFKDAEIIIFSYIGYTTIRLSYNEIVASGNVIALKQVSLSMSEVVVAANRWQQNTAEIPNHISIVTPEQVRLQNPQTTADLLGISGQVHIQKSQLGGGSPMLRGFAANRVLLVIDGVRMNNAIFRSGNLQNVISLDANSIEQTEVVFGPGSVIYGSDAIGGVMSFKSLTPSYSLSDGIDLSGGGMVRASTANEERTAHVNFNIGLQDWAFLTSATVTDYNDQRMGSNGPDDFLREEFVRRVDGTDRVLESENPKDQDPTGFSQFNIIQKIRYRPSNNWDLNLDVHYSTTGDVPRFDRLTERTEGQFRKAEWFFGPQQWLMTNFHANWFAGNKLFDEVKTTIAFQDYEESRNDRNFGSSDLRNRQEKVKAFSANFDFQKELSEKGTLSYGVESVLNWVDSEASQTNIETGEISPVQTRYPDGSTWQSFAGFVNYKHNFSDKWSLTGGARYNQYLIDAPFSDQFFDFPFEEAEQSRGALTGSIGSVFRPDNSWQFNANVSTGFRAPNIDDIGKVFDSEPGSVIVPNPDLDAEYAWNFEAGVKKNIADRVIVDLTGYYTILNNALVRRDFIFNGQDSVLFDGTLSQVQALQNAAEAWVWGIQGNIDLRISDAVNFTSTINIQEGEEEDENGNSEPLRHVAPTFGTSHLKIQPDEKLMVDLYTDYSGGLSFSELAPSERGKPHLYALDENGNPHSPAWYTLNAKASYSINNTADITFGIENITDQRYRTYSSGIAAPGINVIVGIRSSF